MTTKESKNEAAATTATQATGKDERVISAATINAIIQKVEQAEAQFSNYSETFTPAERTRLVSAGIKNFGFIEAAYNSAAVNPGLVPPYLNVTTFQYDVTDFTRIQSLCNILKQFVQQVSDALLLKGDVAYRDALEYYNSVKQAARQHVPGAESEYKRLSAYFKKTRHTSTDEPTDVQIERDVRSLLHGTKEGRIVIENEKPAVSAGKREVLDDVHSERHAFRETIDANEKA